MWSDMEDGTAQDGGIEGRSTKIHSVIARDLGIAIVGGHYLPGDALPGENKFSSDRNISRGAYREAVRTLAAKGMVESRTKSGTRVTERQRWNMLDLDVLAWMFAAGPTDDFVSSIFELRMIVEPQAAALAARRRTGGELSRLGHALEEMGRYGLERAEGRAADQIFHHIILEATRNEPLITLSNSIAAAVNWTTLYARKNRAGLRDPIPDHRDLFEAIAETDAAAARHRMTELVLHAFSDTGLPMADWGALP
jgi:DNA-binding FadR family transcriptional regulator